MLSLILPEGYRFLNKGETVSYECLVSVSGADGAGTWSEWVPPVHSIGYVVYTYENGFYLRGYYVMAAVCPIIVSLGRPLPPAGFRTRKPGEKVEMGDLVSYCMAGVWSEWVPPPRPRKVSTAKILNATGAFYRNGYLYVAVCQIGAVSPDKYALL
jgi:hypothetical protein